MTRRLVLVLLLCITALSAQTKRTPTDQILWSVRAGKPVFHVGEQIRLIYVLENRSDSEILVPKSISPFMSIGFRFYDPAGHLMKWNGARYSFKYNSSDFVVVKPGGKAAGEMQVPAACPHTREMERAGFCFERRGDYTGTADFHLGENASYNRKEMYGALAEGPYVSKTFAFSVR